LIARILFAPSRRGKKIAGRQRARHRSNSRI
jgi:hypothetical protein